MQRSNQLASNVIKPQEYIHVLTGLNSAANEEIFLGKHCQCSVQLSYMNASLSFMRGAVQPKISPGDNGLH